MSNKKFLIVFSIIIVIVAALCVAYALSKRIPMNDETVVGNTAGNLYNGGLFLEMDGKVYFSNPLTSDCLFSMNPDESDLKQLTIMSVQNIVGSGKYLYFYLDPKKTSASSSDISGLGRVSTFYGVYRCDLSGKNQVILDREKISSLQLVGSTLFYTIPLGDNSGVSTIRIDGKYENELTNEAFDPACAENGKIYYAGVALDHNLHVMDTLAGSSSSILLQGNIWQPIVKGTFVYYIDAAHHYRLCRTDLQTNITEVLTNSRIDFYNMNDFNIFYATSEAGNQTLRVMNLDGSGNTVLAEGVFHGLSLTSKYLYFKPFGVDNVMYHIPVDGSEPISTFIPYGK